MYRQYSMRRHHNASSGHRAEPEYAFTSAFSSKLDRPHHYMETLTPTFTCPEAKAMCARGNTESRTFVLQDAIRRADQKTFEFKPGFLSILSSLPILRCHRIDFISVSVRRLLDSFESL
jgi:hypothetical protein